MNKANGEMAVNEVVRDRIARTEPLIAPLSAGAPIAEMLLREKFSVLGLVWAGVLLAWSFSSFISLRPHLRNVNGTGTGLAASTSKVRSFGTGGFSVAVHGLLLAATPLLLGLSKADALSRAVSLGVFGFVGVTSALALSGERLWHAARAVLMFGPLYLWTAISGDWKFATTLTMILFCVVVIHESTTRVGRKAVRIQLANEYLVRELEIANQRLSHDTTHDSLTGLGNRQLFSTHLEAAFCTGDDTTVAVSFVDVDKFKEINDTYGHDVGDAVLVEVGARLSRFCDQSAVAARRSGDEFTVLHSFTAPEVTDAMMSEQLRRSVAGPMVANGHVIHVNCSVGTAFRQQSDSTSSVLRHADEALYAAKRSGRGCGVGHSTITPNQTIVEIAPSTPATA